MYSTPYTNPPLREYDLESAEAKNHGFMRDVRHGFIRKVYGILFTQLAITTILTAICITVAPIQLWMQSNGLPLVIASGVGLLVTVIMLLCCKGVARSFPTNYIVLLVFTLCQSVLVAATAAHTNQLTVLKAAIGAVVITFGLTVFAFQTKYDFTSYAGYMLVLLLSLMVFGILAMFFRNTWVECVYCALGVLVFGLYLIIDTQSLIGRKEFNFEEDDYIIAAMTIYIDIINIFLYLLEMLKMFDSR